MNVLSLFDGISCGRVALERAGIKVDRYLASEIDKYAIQVSKSNWSDIEHLGDVTLIDTKTLPKIDLLIGGSPCQGFSNNGKQLGFEDPRSRLLLDFIRIKEEINPKYFLLENVCMKKEWLDFISSLLRVNYVKLNSSLVSAQRRSRVYWTNIPYLGPPDDIDEILQDIIEDGVVDRDKSYCLTASYYRGISLEHDYLKRKQRQVVFDGSVAGYRALSPIECERLQNLPDNYTSSIPKSQRYKCLGNGWTVNMVAHLLSPIQDK